MSQPLPRETFDRLASVPGPVLVMWHEFENISVHWHDYYEFVFVVDGEGLHHCNGQDEHVSAGSAMLLGPTDFHGYTCAPGQTLRCFNLAIDPWFLERQLGELLRPHAESETWSVSDLSDARAFLDRIWTESRSHCADSAAMAESLLTCVLIMFVRGIGGQSVVPVTAPDEALRRAVFFVEQHFREPITLGLVASEAHLSPNHFSERFHAFTGTTFQEYVQHRRLRFARSLLRSAEVNVTEAARAAGFNDSSHFGRSYRTYFGVTPSVDRNALR